MREQTTAIVDPAVLDLVLGQRGHRPGRGLDYIPRIQRGPPGLASCPEIAAPDDGPGLGTRTHGILLPVFIGILKWLGVDLG